jgi:ketosteroid isomerase-like protein
VLHMTSPHGNGALTVLSHRLLVPYAALIAILASACRPSAPAPLSEADKAAMRRTVEPALAMLTSRTPDWQAFVSMYAEDATVIPGGTKPFVGHEAIIGFLKTLPVLAECRQVSDRLEGSGNLAYEVTTYITRIEPPRAPAVVDTGKEVFVWRKGADGSWRVVVDIWNSIMPQPTAPPANAPTTKRRT